MMRTGLAMHICYLQLFIVASARVVSGILVERYHARHGGSRSSDGSRSYSGIRIIPRCVLSYHSLLLLLLLGLHSLARGEHLVGASKRLFGGLQKFLILETLLALEKPPKIGHALAQGVKLLLDLLCLSLLLRALLLLMLLRARRGRVMVAAVVMVVMWHKRRMGMFVDECHVRNALAEINNDGQRTCTVVAICCFGMVCSLSRLGSVCTLRAIIAQRGESLRGLDRPSLVF
ncbi:hypothetical protein BCR43DRAFT_141682 [Syncephalastrum racemosum]|uniref:Uncharacterized protein n=1 Tax=Syncephalastrum racemosum TaxID=13706 RepID=A0A1X2HM16_SYNRA|nr:hypothetical protein BCR43DRAFT_141682 [Syncephalastrum racemosum]